MWGQEHHRGRVETPAIAGPVDRWVEGVTQGISEVPGPPEPSERLQLLLWACFLDDRAQHVAAGKITASGGFFAKTRGVVFRLKIVTP